MSGRAGMEPKQAGSQFCLSVPEPSTPAHYMLESCLAPNTDLLNKGFQQGPPE